MPDLMPGMLFTTRKHRGEKHTHVLLEIKRYRRLKSGRLSKKPTNPVVVTTLGEYKLCFFIRKIVTPKQVDVFADDISWQVRRAVASRSRSKDTLVRYLSDPHPQVRAKAAKRLGRQLIAEQREALINDEDWSVREALFWLGPSREELRKLGKDPDPRIRRSAAYRLPLEELVMFKDDKNEDVKSAVKWLMRDMW